MTEPKKGRPRKGSLERRGNNWYARLTVSVEGESIRRRFDLGTQSRPVARRKLKRLVREFEKGTPLPELAKQAERDETVSEAADRILEDRDVRDTENDPIRYRLHIKDHIGHMPITEVRTSHIRDVLDSAKDAGKSRRTLTHIRRVMNLVFDVLWRDEVIAENPVARVKVSAGKLDRRERAVLTDAELAIYLGWEHPDERYRDGVRERQTLACVSRMFGGLRTGDLHALRWEALDTENGNFNFGWAPRRKTARPQLLEVPAMLRPILQDWWQRAGRPKEGLVFPAQKGKRAGDAALDGQTVPKTGVSHAGAFRQDLKRAFAVEKLDGNRWVKNRDMTAREKELFEDTEFTRPVDFHSFRRSFSQALAEANVSAQQAQALAGHASLDAHQRYLVNTAKMRALPLEALPKIRVIVPTSGTKVGARNSEERLRGQDLVAGACRFRGVPRGVGDESWLESAVDGPAWSSSKSANTSLPVRLR